MTVTIPCNHCNGKGRKPLASTLLLVYKLVPKRATTLGAIAALLPRPMSRNSLHAKLTKLTEHGLLTRINTDDGYAWSRS